jgi:hypothetical protein
MKRFNRFFCIFLLFFCAFHIFGDNTEEIDLNKYQIIIFTLIDNLNEIVQDNPVNELVYQTFSVSHEAIRNNKVSFKIDPKMNSVLSGMSFNTYESGEVSLAFGLKYLDTYHPESSIHYSILIHEYRHLYDYLRLGEGYKNSHNDEKEKYWFELDAMRIETEFIKTYLAEDYELSKYEELLLHSLENDNLNVASTLFLRTSMNVFFYFDRLEIRYKNHEITKEDIIGDLEQRGWIYTNGYNENNNDYIKYGRYREIVTFRRYLTRILITMNDIPELTWEELFSQYEDIGEIYYTIGDIINADESKHMSYWKSTIDSFESDITDK